MLFSFAQTHWANKVLAHQFGLGQTVGQDSLYFPKNILGAVSASVSATVPANTPNEIVSLGRNGWVALGFEGNIVDGTGADFTVFENAFQFAGGIFDEWLMVSVSQDGETWVTFPYDSLTGAGMAGRTPTNGGNANYLDATQSGGNSFDLADVGLAWAKYVKVTDATKFQTPDKLSAELDAIIAIHLDFSAISPKENLSQFIDFQYDEEYVYLQTSRPLHLELWDMNGQKLQEKELFPAENPTLLIRNLAFGVYIWAISDGEKREYVKWVKR